MTLIDKILRGDLVLGWWDRLPNAALLANMSHAVVVDATAAIRQLVETSSPGEPRLLSDLPCLAPPWPSAWVEADIPSSNGVARIGWFVSRFERDESERPVVDDLARWVVGVVSFKLLSDGRIIAPQSLCVAYVGAQGEYRGWGQEIRSIDGRQPPNDGWEAYPLFFAITMLHCKNAVLDPIHVPRRIAKRIGAGHGEIRRYTLRIEQAMRAIRRDAPAGIVGSKALHACRGHFKDYRESGLFGRTKGVFWFSEHERGSATDGVIIKDYAIGKQEE